MSISSSNSIKIHNYSCGVFVFQPYEAKIFPQINKETKTRVSCKFKVGHHSRDTKIAKGGSNPIWSDAVVLERRHGENVAKMTIQDHRKGTLIHHKLGEASVDLSEAISHGDMTQWYELKKENKICGKVLLRTVYIDV